MYDNLTRHFNSVLTHQQHNSPVAFKGIMTSPPGVIESIRIHTMDTNIIQNYTELITFIDEYSQQICDNKNNQSRIYSLSVILKSPKCMEITTPIVVDKSIKNIGVYFIQPTSYLSSSHAKIKSIQNNAIKLCVSLDLTMPQLKKKCANALTEVNPQFNGIEKGLTIISHFASNKKQIQSQRLKYMTLRNLLENQDMIVNFNHGFLAIDLIFDSNKCMIKKEKTVISQLDAEYGVKLSETIIKYDTVIFLYIEPALVIHKKKCQKSNKSLYIHSCLQNEFMAKDIMSKYFEFLNLLPSQLSTYEFKSKQFFDWFWMKLKYDENSIYYDLFKTMKNDFSKQPLLISQFYDLFRAIRYVIIKQYDKEKEKKQAINSQWLQTELYPINNKTKMPNLESDVEHAILLSDDEKEKMMNLQYDVPYGEVLGKLSIDEIEDDSDIDSHDNAIVDID